MKKNLFYFAALLVLIANQAISQTKLIEKVTKKGTEIVIPYEKYILSNGLIVLVHEDHSDPVVYVDVTYHVGSAREEVGRSGFAHFFEHMMFQGSDNVADEEHFKTVSNAGGDLNGTTNTDRTNYFETVPSNQLEVAIWLESDRMGFLLDAVTQKKFEVQRATVKNERGQNYDNRPYGLVAEKVDKALYPYKHPYSWPTIGYLEDLDRVDVNDLKSFFLRWYGPNNATLTVAGDVSAAEVVKLAEKYFGAIPKCPEVKNQSKELVKIDKDRYISYEDNIRFPLLYVGYPGVPANHPDEPALDVLANILGGNESSYLYQKLQKTQKSVQVSASDGTQELGGIFAFVALSFPGNSLEDMEKGIKEAMEDFEKAGVKDEDLERFKISYESDVIQALSSVRGKGARLAQYQTFTGDANYIQKEVKAYQSVTKEDVMRVYKTYIKGKPAVYLSVVPKGKPEMVAHKDNYTPPVTNINDADHKEYQNLKYVKAKDNFDRKIKPKPGANPVINVPQLWTEFLPNSGLKIIGTKTDEIPSVTLLLSVEMGHRLESKDKAGIASLLAGVMEMSTEHFTDEQLSDALEKLGSSISISAGENELSIYINSLTKNLDATLKIAEEMLFHPKFDKDEFERSKNEQLQGIANQATSASTIANNAFKKVLYGNNSIMGIPSVGTAATVKSITLDDVKQYYTNYFSPRIANMVVVGDITKEALLPKLSFLDTWPGKKVALPTPDPVAEITKTKIYLVNKDKAPQSEIRIGKQGLAYDPFNEYYKNQIMNFTYGGNFNSRININLREDKGWTYGINSYFSGSKYAGHYLIYAGVKGEATDSSLVEIIKEMNKYANEGVTEEELQFAKNSMGQADALRFETPMQKAGFLKRIADYNLDPSYIKKQNDILQGMTKAEIDALAKKNLQLDQMFITVVGDKKSILPGLQKLGYEIIELDSDGNVIPGNNNQDLYKNDEPKDSPKVDKKKEEKKK